ncbi:MAG: hypothetical protein JNN15_15755 [Blastocatellia bacterium]|nr:hypothetical protein [Blastocatellia bacterium]
MRKIILFLLAVSVLVITMSIPQLSKASSVQTMSTVTFEFDGMMGLFMGSSDKVSVGLLSAHHHMPEMVVYKLIRGEKREIARFRGEQLKRTINISVTGTNLANFTRPRYYQALDGQSSDERDFRWILDIERDVYKRRLRIKDNFYGKIHFNSGMFYSSRLSDEMVKLVSLDGKSSLPFLRKIAKPANKINLTNEQKLTIEDLTESINLIPQDNIDYLVSITNLPPEDMANIDHFKFYYDVIDEDVTRYTLVEVKRSFFTTNYHCFPLLFGESFIN